MAQTPIRRIAGIWTTGGYSDGRGALYCIINGQRILDADPMAGPDSVLRCEQWGSDAPIITNGCWQFWPDESELTRLGLVPTQMIRTAA